MENNQSSQEAKIGFKKSKKILFLASVQFICAFYSLYLNIQNSHTFKSNVFLSLGIYMIPVLFVFFAKKESVYSFTSFLLVICSIPLFFTCVIVSAGSNASW